MEWRPQQHWVVLRTTDLNTEERSWLEWEARRGRRPLGVSAAWSGSTTTPDAVSDELSCGRRPVAGRDVQGRAGALAPPGALILL